MIDSLPSFAVESIREAMPYLGRKLKGFDDDNAVMKAVETRSSSPVRFLGTTIFREASKVFTLRVRAQDMLVV